MFQGSTPIAKDKGFFHLLAWNAATGADAWRADYPWPGYGHGAQTSYPIVIGDKLFYSPHVLSVDTGKRLPIEWHEGACGITSASRHALFYRFFSIAFWDIARGTETRWPTVRPDCWLSVLPAEGLLLAPEGGGGCVCSAWLETSAALAPRTDFAVFRSKQERFLGSLAVELVPPVGDGTLHYTTDGSDPTANSPRYERPIRIEQTTTVRARVFGGRDARHGGPEVARRFERLAPATLPRQGRVKFQPVTVGAAPQGDLLDVGEPLALQSGGCVYGWSQDAFESMWALAPAKRTDPLRHGGVWLNSQNSWEMALPNGQYEVTLCLGHPESETKRRDAGAVLVADGRFELDRDLAKGEMVEVTRRVTIGDGRLQLRKDPADKTSTGVAWLRFRRVDAGADR
jgi:hypothetical protein